MSHNQPLAPTRTQVAVSRILTGLGIAAITIGSGGFFLAVTR